MTSWRPPLRFLAHATLFVCVASLCFEAFFRWGLPARESPIPTEEPDFHLRCFVPGQTGLFTSGRLAEQRARYSINGQCWNSGVEYREDPAGAPLVAMTGDSQLEGLYVEWPEHLAAQTADRLGARGYSFAGSGYKVVHFAMVARYLAQHGFDPRYFVIQINRGDFWSGVVQLGANRANPRLDLDPGTGRFTELAGARYRTSSLRRLLRSSALVRYVVFNARVNPFVSKDADVELGMADLSRYPESDPQHHPMMAAAARWLLDEVAKALPRTEVVFLVDADRRSIYRGDTPLVRLGSAAVLHDVCAARRCGVLDLTDAFAEHFRRTGEKLNFEHNYHWTSRGHAVAAEALAGYLRRTGRWPTE